MTYPINQRIVHVLTIHHAINQPLIKASLSHQLDHSSTTHEALLMKTRPAVAIAFWRPKGPSTNLAPQLEHPNSRSVHWNLSLWSILANIHRFITMSINHHSISINTSILVSINKLNILSILVWIKINEDQSSLILFKSHYWFYLPIWCRSQTSWWNKSKVHQFCSGSWLAA